MKAYSTRDVAALLGLSEDQVRSYARAGFLHPERGERNEYRFSFQDLVLLRTAAGLLAADVPPRRVRQVLERVQDQLPRGRSLSEVRIAAEGDRVVVHDGETAWNPLSGQYHLDFTVAELGQKVAPLARRAAAEVGEAAAGAGGVGADDWYELGLDLEAYAPTEARTAYERALELDPGHADANVNLGRLLHDAGDAAAAERHYRRALETGEHATAAYNLGIVLEDLGRREEAAAAYERAVAFDSELADAHFNLARLHEAAGRTADAIRHLRTYKWLTEERARGRR